MARTRLPEVEGKQTWDLPPGKFDSLSGKAVRNLSRINLALRAIMEFAIVVGLGYWGYHTGTTILARILMSVGVPMCTFAFWGFVDFHQAGRSAEPLRLLQELTISGLAVLALYLAGKPLLGWALAAITILHHLMVYALGERLLKR